MVHTERVQNIQLQSLAAWRKDPSEQKEVEKQQMQEKLFALTPVLGRVGRIFISQR